MKAWFARMLGLRAPDVPPPDERISLAEAARHIQQSLGCSEQEAIDELLGALSGGKIRAFGVNSQTGIREQVPVSYFPEP